jgi:hypothetical protein
MKPISVAAFNSRDEAEPLRARLVAAGIAAEIHKELRMDTALGFGCPSAGVRIEVPREDFETALQMVYGWNADQDGSLNPPPPDWMVPPPMPERTSASLQAREGPRQDG